MRDEGLRSGGTRSAEQRGVKGERRGEGRGEVREEVQRGFFFVLGEWQVFGATRKDRGISALCAFVLAGGWGWGTLGDSAYVHQWSFAREGWSETRKMLHIVRGFQGCHCAMTSWPCFAAVASCT